MLVPTAQLAFWLPVLSLPYELSFQGAAALARLQDIDDDGNRAIPV
jgi:hypothetical protein